MDTNIGCPLCKTQLDLLSAIRDKNGKLFYPKERRYRLKCECGWGTWLSKGALTNYYETSPEVKSGLQSRIPALPPKSNYETVLDRINEVLEDMESLPDFLADYIEKKTVLLEGIAQTINTQKRVSGKQLDTVVGIHEDVIRKLEKYGR